MTVVRVKNRLAEDYEAHSTAGKPQILGPALSIMSVETLTLSSTRTENLYLNSKRTKTLNPKLDLERTPLLLQDYEVEWVDKEDSAGSPEDGGSEPLEGGGGRSR